MLLVLLATSTITRGYIGDNTMGMPTVEVKYLITESQGLGVACVMGAPLFCQARVSFNPNKLYLIVQCRYIRMWHDAT